MATSTRAHLRVCFEIFMAIADSLLLPCGWGRLGFLCAGFSQHVAPVGAVLHLLAHAVGDDRLVLPYLPTTAQRLVQSDQVRADRGTNAGEIILLLQEEALCIHDPLKV